MNYKNNKLGVGALALTGALMMTGCSTNGYRIQDTDSALRDFSLSQTQYINDLVSETSCKEAKVEDYKGLSGKVKKYFSSLVDDGYEVCDITNGVTPSEHNKGLLTIIDLVNANRTYDCGVMTFDDNKPILSRNTSLDFKLDEAQNLVDNNPRYMAALATEVRNCVAGEDIKNTFYQANSSDATSAGIWLSVLSFSLGNSAGSSGSSRGCSTGTSSSTVTTGNATNSGFGTTGGSAGVGGVLTTIITKGC